jgi:hypothetical protein
MPPRLLHFIHRCASAIGRASLQNCRPQRSCTGRGRIRLLGSDLRDCSLASSNSSSHLIYLFVECATRVITFNVNSVRPIIIKEPQVTYAFSSQIMSYLLDMLICVGMILLDNLLQCLLFVAMIDLSRTCYSTATIICNVLIMSMIYPWIKIKLVVLLFPTIQKPYCRHFSFMAGFVDALKHAPFTGANFKRLQMRITLWLTPMNVF